MPGAKRKGGQIQLMPGKVSISKVKIKRRRLSRGQREQNGGQSNTSCDLGNPTLPKPRAWSIQKGAVDSLLTCITFFFIRIDVKSGILYSRLLIL